MIELWTSKGMAPADASSAIHAIARYPELFVDCMMSEELGLTKPDHDPWRIGVVALAGFGLWSFAAAAAWLVAVRQHAVPGVAVLEAATRTADFVRAWLSTVAVQGGMVDAGASSLAHTYLAWFEKLAVAADPAAALILVSIAVLWSHGLVHATLLPLAGRGKAPWRLPGIMPGFGMLLAVSIVAGVAALLGGDRYACK